MNTDTGLYNYNHFCTFFNFSFPKAWQMILSIAFHPFHLTPCITENIFSSPFLFLCSLGFWSFISWLLSFNNYGKLWQVEAITRWWPEIADAVPVMFYFVWQMSYIYSNSCRWHLNFELSSLFSNSLLTYLVDLDDVSTLFLFEMPWLRIWYH